MFLSDRKKVLKLPFNICKQIKAYEPEVELLVSKWNPEAILKSSRKYCSRIQICKIIELIDSVETVLLKYKMSNI